MQTKIQYDPEQWEARDSEFCPKYPILTEDKQGEYMAIIMHNVTLARAHIYASNLEDLNKLIAYFVHSHKNVKNGWDSLLYIAGYENGKLLQCEDIVVKREPEPTRELRPAEVFDNLRRSGYKQFKGIFTYLSRGNKHCFQTTTNSYVMAEVNGTEVIPIMAFRSKLAMHKYFGF